VFLKVARFPASNITNRCRACLRFCALNSHEIWDQLSISRNPQDYQFWAQKSSPQSDVKANTLMLDTKKDNCPWDAQSKLCPVSSVLFGWT
jgi:hypothetical protein